MKLLRSVAISALCLTAASAVPYDDFEGLDAIADEFQTIMSSGGRMSGKMHNAFDALGETGKNVLKKSKKLFDEAESKAERWVEDGKEFIKQQGTVYELLAHPVFADHQLRVTEPTLCDPDVQQYSGYLDITEGNLAPP